MSEYSNTIETLAACIVDAVQKRMEHINCDRTFQSVILNVNTDGTYQILYIGQKYNVKNGTLACLKRGDNVWVKIPCNDLKRMHICGVINEK